ncbi:adenylyl-sulfate kinase [Wenyingzhuangia sp. IMCC45533]
MIGNNLREEIFFVDKKKRNKLNNHKSLLFFFTGFSGSGKSTLANALEVELHKQGVRTFILDGDNLRSGLNSNLSFLPEDRSENLRRVGEVSKLMIEAGIVVIASFIAPYQKDREKIKNIVGKENYFEVHVSTSIKECIRRDVKGLYKKVKKGEIKNFTGIDAPYEFPEKPDMKIDTEKEDLCNAISSILKNTQNKILL